MLLVNSLMLWLLRREVEQGRMKSLNIAILMPSWLGDACMTTPALRALRVTYPGSKLIGVMSPLIAKLLCEAEIESENFFDEQILFHKRWQGLRKRSGNRENPGSTQSVCPRQQLPKMLRSKEIDAILLMTNSWWSALVARLARIRTIVGYDRDMRRLLLTDPIRVAKEAGRPKPISAIDYYLELVGWLGCDTTNRTMKLPLGGQDSPLASRLWERLEFDAARRTVVINSSAAKDTSRVWPAEKVRDCALQLANEDDLQVLIHCGPAERVLANQIAEEADHRLIGSMGVMEELPVALSRGVLSRASAVISSDSGARHMAVALNRPVVSLFGPTDVAWTRTYNKPEISLNVSLDCRPCYRSECPLVHHRCMRDLSVQRVVAAVRQQLMTEASQASRLDRAA